ncbi:helix-turn-helix transcriptional regulator [Nocardia sp. NPDC059229]|uniref:helix-turn-helix transcriptional regulator n=1 Tax=Nocardia sp. NPDC059229 TaxID=3346778 RepID=UPI0036C35C50
MKEASGRLLRLLGLLQMRREWSGQELADRLDITTRTVRRDIDKLRALDYPVQAAKGITGGYWLGAGAELPPLLLDDEEAVAIAIALRTATGSGVAGQGETALRALVKLEQVLPERLRNRLNALQIATVQTPETTPAVAVDVLTAIAAACRDQQRVRFRYAGSDMTRTVERHQLVSWGRRWYLVAWDGGRADWRTFRVDRMELKTPVGPRFTPRALPGDDAAAFVACGIAQRWPFRATLRLHAPAESDAARATATYGSLEPVDEHSCLLHIGSEDARSLTFLLGALTIDFDVVDGPELARELRATAERFAAAASAGLREGK